MQNSDQIIYSDISFPESYNASEIQKRIPEKQQQYEMSQFKKSSITFVRSVKFTNKYNHQECIYYSHLVDSLDQKLIHLKQLELIKQKERQYISYILKYASILILEPLDKLRNDKQYFRMMLERDKLIIQKRSELQKTKNFVIYYTKLLPNQYNFPTKCLDYRDFQQIKPQFRKLLNILYKSLSNQNSKQQSDRYEVDYEQSIRIRARITYILIFKKVKWDKYKEELPIFANWISENNIKDLSDQQFNARAYVDNYLNNQNVKNLQKDITLIFSKFYQNSYSRLTQKSSK